MKSTEFIMICKTEEQCVKWYCLTVSPIPIKISATRVIINATMIKRVRAII